MREPAQASLILLWDATRNKPVAAISHNGNFVAQVCYSPDGTLLATAGGDRAVILWDTTKLQEVSRVSGDAPIAFAPKGNWLVVRDHGATLRLTRVPIRKVKVSLPRFKATMGFNLRDKLQSLGMTTAFIHVVHGRFLEAWLTSPLGVGVFAGVVAAIAFVAGHHLWKWPAVRIRLSRGDSAAEKG